MEFSDECTKLCLQNVLIVDSDSENLVSLYGLFSGLGLETVLCSSGFKAISAFQEKFAASCCSNKFQIIMAELEMPKMDGHKFGQCIRATESTFANQVALKSSACFKKANFKCPMIGMVRELTIEQNEKAKQMGF